MAIPLYVDRNLALGVIALVAALTLTARRGLVPLWITVALLAVAAVVTGLVLGSVSIWSNGCRPLCGVGWDVPGPIVALGVLGVAAMLSVRHMGSRPVPIWLRAAIAALVLWIVLRGHLSPWMS